MSPDDELDAYVHDVLAWLTARPPVGDRVLVERVHRSIRQSLRDLNDLPPDDPFWVGTNRRPTVMKAADRNGNRFVVNPEDASAVWAATSWTLLHCQYGAKETFRHLPADDPRTIRWITGASEWVTLVSGPDMADALRSAIVQVPTAEAHLQWLRLSDDPLDRRAAAICAAVIGGSTVTSAVRSADRE